jgi:hypothetical protein
MRLAVSAMDSIVALVPVGTAVQNVLYKTAGTVTKDHASARIGSLCATFIFSFD